MGPRTELDDTYEMGSSQNGLDKSGAFTRATKQRSDLTSVLRGADGLYRDTYSLPDPVLEPGISWCRAVG